MSVCLSVCLLTGLLKNQSELILLGQFYGMVGRNPGQIDQSLVVRIWIWIQEFLKDFHHYGIGNGTSSWVRKQSENTRASGPQIEQIKAALVYCRVLEYCISLRSPTAFIAV